MWIFYLMQAFDNLVSMFYCLMQQGIFVFNAVGQRALYFFLRYGHCSLLEKKHTRYLAYSCCFMLPVSDLNWPASIFFIWRNTLLDIGSPYRHIALGQNSEATLKNGILKVVYPHPDHISVYMYRLLIFPLSLLLEL